MQIPSETPFVSAPAAPKTYPDLWLYSLCVLAPSIDSGRIELETLPFDYSTKEISPEGKQTVRTDQLWSAIEEVPEVAQAFAAVAAAVPALKAWLAAKEAAAAQQTEPGEEAHP